MIRTASCTCGALKAECEGEPVRISVCHCLDCQRRTGAVFSTQAHWPEERVKLEGEAREFTRHGDEGYWGTFSFCPTCGGTVWYRIERRPGIVSVPVGAFADPNFPEPRVSVWEERRHPWVALATEGPLDRSD
jgi:hypothetical protein